MMSKRAYENLALPTLGRVAAVLQQLPIPEELRPLQDYAMCNGRRFRCLLVTLGHDLLIEGEPSDGLIALAAAVELLHKASLIHDDIVDKDDYRRGRKAFHVTWGVPAGVVMPDLLIAQAFGIAAEAPGVNSAIRCRALGLLARTVQSMSIGQLQQIIQERSEFTFDEAVEINRKKSGSLTSLAVSLGCLVAGGDETQIIDAREIGDDIGQLFQIMNDLNNLTGLEQSTGRARGTDLDAGRSTTITSLLARSDSNSDAASLSLDSRLEKSLPQVRAVIEGYSKRLLANLETRLSRFPRQATADLALQVARGFEATWFWENLDAAEP